MLVIPGLGKTWTDLITIPLFTGIIGYITNWTGVIMLFRPIRFKGIRVPGLKFLYPYLPRRVQVVPPNPAHVSSTFVTSHADGVADRGPTPPRAGSPSVDTAGLHERRFRARCPADILPIRPQR